MASSHSREMTSVVWYYVGTLSPASPTDTTPPIPSGWALRQRLAERGYGVSDGQLDEFMRWGLIERRPDGFPPGTDERLVEILEAAKEARPLPRRVVRLRADYHAFPTPARPLQRAFVELAPTIRAPAKKTRAVEAAWVVMASRGTGRPISRRRGRIPPGSEWSAIITAIPPEQFEMWVTGWYSLASNVLPAYAREAGLDIEWIPIEERAVIVAVLHHIKSGET